MGDERAPTATPSEAMEREWTEQMERITASLRHTYNDEQHAAAGRAVTVPSIADVEGDGDDDDDDDPTEYFDWDAYEKRVDGWRAEMYPTSSWRPASSGGERRAKLSNRESTRLAEILRERSADAPAEDDFVPETEEEAELAARGRQLAEAMEAAGEAAKASEFGPSASSAQVLTPPMCIDEAATAYPSAEPPMAAVCEAICEVSISERSAADQPTGCAISSNLNDAELERSAQLDGASDSWCGENGGTSTDTKVKPELASKDAPIALITSQSVASGGECAPSVPASSLASRIAARRKESFERRKARTGGVRPPPAGRSVAVA